MDTEAKAEQLVRDHVKANVTGLVDELCRCGSKVGLRIAHGDTTYSTGYPLEVWVVSHWLSRKLKSRGCIVTEHRYQHYWGRGRAGGVISADPVILDIAKREKL
jgi:hypothetical protein